MPAGDLDRALVEAALERSGTRLGRPLHVCAVTGSTSDDARAAAAAGDAHGACFLAAAQTHGRGRGGHRWHSPPGGDLYLSILLRPALLPRAMAPFTLAVGVAVAHAVEARLPGCGAQLKWPNDVLVAGKKIAGVLVEGQVRGDALSSLVVGIGVNVGASAFPDELASRATSLRLAGATELDREPLAADVIARVGAALEKFERSGLQPFAEEIARRDALLGRAVETDGARGVACGIDSSGRLLVELAGGERRAVLSGEVRLPPRP